MQYKPSVFAEMIGVSVKTLQRWDNSGKLKASRSDTDRRYYTYEQYLKYKGIQEPKENNNFDISPELVDKLNQFATKYNTTSTEIIETLIYGMDMELVIGKSNIYQLCKKHCQNEDNEVVKVKNIKDTSKEDLKARIKLRRNLIRVQNTSRDSIIYKEYEKMKQQLKELE